MCEQQDKDQRLEAASLLLKIDFNLAGDGHGNQRDPAAWIGVADLHHHPVQSGNAGDHASPRPVPGV